MTTPKGNVETMNGRMVCTDNKERTRLIGFFIDNNDEKTIEDEQGSHKEGFRLDSKMNSPDEDKDLILMLT